MEKTTSINLPTPAELAGAREETRNVSLRIKAHTFRAFEQWAKDYDTSVNNLISKLLDAYIEAQKENKD